MECFDITCAVSVCNYENCCKFGFSYCKRAGLFLFSVQNQNIRLNYSKVINWIRYKKNAMSVRQMLHNTGVELVHSSHTE